LERLGSAVAVATEAVLATADWAVGNGRSAVTAKTLATTAPDARLPSESEQVEPALAAEQDQPGEEAVGLNVVAAGTVSWRTLVKAVSLPKLLTVRV
jgi:hypothetical protein